MCGDCAIDVQTGIGPVANPIAVVQVRVTGIAIAHERFMMAPSGADRARPASMAIVFGVDMSAVEKVGLLFAIDSGGDVAQRVRV